MSNPIHIANAEFPFDSLTLANPHGLQGGAYFSKLHISGEPVLIQTPKCLTKNGIHKTEKKIYCDLMFINENEDFISWIQTLETTIKHLIYEKRNLWFHNDMDADSIDYHWQTLLRTYKGNKSLLRCFFTKPKGLQTKDLVQIYDEEENVLTFDDVEKTSKLISILEVSGLKFTSQSFQIEFNIKQMMIIKKEPIFSKCLIKINMKEKLTLQSLETDTTNVDSDAESDISIEDKNDQTKNVDTSEETPPKNENSEIDASQNLIAPDLESKPNSNDIPLVISDDNDNDIQQKDVSVNNVEEDISSNKVEDKSEISENSKTDVEKDLEETVNSSTSGESLEKDGIINEIEILPPSESADMMTLKNPNEVYMEIYKEAKRKAKEAKKIAVQAYLEAKRIKSLYLLDEIESSEDDIEFEEFAE